MIGWLFLVVAVSIIVYFAGSDATSCSKQRAGYKCGHHKGECDRNP